MKLLKELNFDENENVLKNVNGIVFDSQNQLSRNIFTVGWVKIGAKGVIDTTLRDSYDTAASILERISNGILEEKSTDYDCIAKIFSEKGVKPITYEDCKVVDAYEIKTGKIKNKIREKITDLYKMFSLINH